MTLPLFNEQPKEQADFRRPLADRLRPANWEQFAFDFSQVAVETGGGRD